MPTVNGCGPYTIIFRCLDPRGTKQQLSEPSGSLLCLFCLAVPEEQNNVFLRSKQTYVTQDLYYGLESVATVSSGHDMSMHVCMYVCMYTYAVVVNHLHIVHTIFEIGAGARRRRRDAVVLWFSNELQVRAHLEPNST